MYRELLQSFEQFEGKLDDTNAEEARTNAEAVIRVELAEIIARAAVLIRALAADERPKG